MSVADRGLVWEWLIGASMDRTERFLQVLGYHPGGKSRSDEALDKKEIMSRVEMAVER